MELITYYELETKYENLISELNQIYLLSQAVNSSDDMCSLQTYIAEVIKEG